MIKNKATLKDIANAMGVSTTTVHRALHEKNGISDKTKTEAKEIAAQMGYRVNYMASALKRKDINIAIALPETVSDNQYYYTNLWNGVQDFLKEIPEFNVKALNFHYPLSPGSNGIILKKIYKQYSEQIDGLLTIGDNHEQSSYYIEKLAAKKIPISLIGADLYKDSRLCCVKTYDEIAGSLAAELLTTFLPSTALNHILLTGNPVGPFSMLDQHYNITGFEAYIKNYAPQTKLECVYYADAKEAYQQIKKILTISTNISAAYSCSARHTIQLCQAVIELQMQDYIKIIGNDNFPESINFLKQGILTAIIDKKVSLQSYTAAKILFDFIIKGESPSSTTIQIQPEILLKSNISLYDT